MIYILTMSLHDFQLKYDDYKLMSYNDIKCYTRLYIEHLGKVDKTMHKISQNILLNYQKQVIMNQKRVRFDLSRNTIKHI
jgi:hypothetical protein